MGVDDGLELAVADLQYIEQPQRTKRWQTINNIPLSYCTGLARRGGVEQHFRIRQEGSDRTFADSDTVEIAEVDAVGKRGGFRILRFRR
jgi:hypothetical protein